MVYVWLWVGLVPASLLLGPVVRALSPVRTLHWLVSRVSGGDPGAGIAALPRWVGLWPAALGLLAFVWLELVYPEANYLASLRLWFAVYAAVLLVGAAVFGDRWIAAADPFEVYSTLVSHLGVVGRREDGTLVWRSPLANLDAVPALPGLTAVTAVLLGSTAWDSFSDSIAWVRFTADLSVPLVLVETLGLLLLCLAVAAALRGRHLGDGLLALRRRGARRTSSRTRWFRSWSATSWPTTSATASRSVSRPSPGSATRWWTAATCSAPPTSRSATG